jgi:hypothetical protein
VTTRWPFGLELRRNHRAVVPHGLAPPAWPVVALSDGFVAGRYEYERLEELVIASINENIILPAEAKVREVDKLLRDIRRPIEPADEGMKMSQDIRRMSKEDFDRLNELSAPIDKDDISLLPSRLRQIRERKPCLPRMPFR